MCPVALEVPQYRPLLQCLQVLEGWASTLSGSTAPAEQTQQKLPEVQEAT